MSAMVDRGGGRDVLKSYNPPPSYASVLSGRRAQSFFGGSTPSLPKRNSESSTKELGRHEKRVSNSVDAEPLPASSRIGPSTTSHSHAVSTGTQSATTTTYYSSGSNISTTPHLEPVEKMEQSRACSPGMEPENQKFIHGLATSLEKVNNDRNDSGSSRSNRDATSSFNSTNQELSRNVKTTYRDEPNERRVWSTLEHSQRRSDDDGKRGSFTSGRNVNNYRNDRTDARPRYDNLEDKENQNSSEKRKSFLPDQDGWLTKVPIQKKAKNEKPLQQGQKGTRFGEVQKYAGQQRPGVTKPTQLGRGRDTRREYQGGRQTIVYSNSRGSAFGRRLSTRGTPPERNLSSSAPRRNDMFNMSPPQAIISASSAADSVIAISGSTASVTAVPRKSVSFLPQPIVITSTTVCRPDLTPPPPPACGTFSYRDILTKGIQSPPTPVRASKTDKQTESEKNYDKLEKRPEMRSGSTETNISSFVHDSSDIRDPSIASPSPLISGTAQMLIPLNDEKNSDQHMNPSSTRQTLPNEVFTSVSNDNKQQSVETYSSKIQSRRELVTDVSQSYLTSQSHPIQPDHPSSGPPSDLEKCSSVETSLMLGVPPGFKNHILETSRIASFNTSNASVPQSVESNVGFGSCDTFNISAMPTGLSQKIAAPSNNTELGVLQEESMVHQTNHGTSDEKDRPSNFPLGNVSEIEDATLRQTHDTEIAGYLLQEPDVEQDSVKSKDYFSSENAAVKPEKPSPYIVRQSSDFSEESTCGELNDDSSLRFGENLLTKHPESSGLLFTRGASSSPAKTSETSTFNLSETNSESSTPSDPPKNKYEFTKPSLDQGQSSEEVNNLTNNCNVSFIDKKSHQKTSDKDHSPGTKYSRNHKGDSVVLEVEQTGRESEFQPNEPLSAGELLQQIQSSQNIFSKRGVILNKVQENLSFSRSKKNTERAPAPPPTPNDDSYSGGWGSTPVEDADPEGSPFHLITSAAKELEHSISNNSKESNDMSNICSVESKGNNDRIKCSKINFGKVDDSSESEGVTTQTYKEKDVASDSSANFNADLEAGNDKKHCSSDKTLDSCQDTSYNTIVDHDLNNNKIDECNLHLSENETNVQQVAGKGLETMQRSVQPIVQRSVQPIVIKPMGKLDAYFPNSAQTWTPISEDVPKIGNIDALPRRVPKTKFRSDDHVVQSSIEAEEEVYGIQEVNAEKTSENVSHDMKEKYQISEPATVQSPASSKRGWPEDDPSSVSPNIYSSMNADGSTSENLQVTSTSLSENIAGFTSEIQSSIPPNTNDIWRTNQSKPNLTLPKSKLLTMERPETSPLETLMKHSSATSINLSVNFFKDTNSKITTTVQTPVPLTSSQLHTTTVTTPKEQRSLVGSGTDSTYDTVAKAADVGNQPCFIGTNPSTGQPTVSSCSQEFYHLTQQGSNVLSGRTPNIPSGIPSLMQVSSLNPYPHQSPLSLPTQLNIQAQEMDFQHLSRMSSGQHGSLTQQPSHLNYVQPPAAPLQYPNMFDPRWSNNYSLDVNQSEWLNINRFSNSERDFARPPQLHPLSQPVSLFNYPPPSMPPQKESMFPNFNYPPPTFQPGYRLQTLPGFLQRPPPPLPPQYNSGYYNRAMDSRNSPSLRPPLHVSPNRREQSFGNVRNKLEVDRMRPPGHLQSQYHDMGNKPSPNESYANQFGGVSNLNSEQHSGRYDPNHGNKLLRPGASRQPHDPTLADYIPRNLEAYNKNQAAHESSFNSSWKQKNLYSDKRGYESGRKTFKPDSKEEVPYPPLPSSETYSESDNQMGGSRRKNTFKGSLSASEPVKSSKPHIQETKQNTPMDYHKHEKLPIQMQYSNPNEMFLAGQAYPNLLPPLEFGPNPIAFGYPDNVNDPAIDKGGNPLADFSGVVEKPECDDSQLSHASSPFDVQDFCSGGWKYYHETITSPSGLRIHQSTYVPYPNPCGSMTTAYLSTNDVRARIQWLGFKKANELYTAKINAQRSLRMDVTVVCSKGGAVCCNSDILGTCSAYFHDRLFGRTDEYITIFVNVPSKIMKHFLQMMSCGEVFVPINDVNEVIMKAPIYLNLNM